MRIGGLASGMDTDQMVKEMMKAESIKVDRVKADKQILEWKKESLNSLNKDLADFVLGSKKDLGYNVVGRPGNMDWIKSATSSDEKIGTATAGKGAFGGKHTVNVTKLAEGVSGVSKKNVNEKDWTKKKFDFEINGKKINVSDTDSIESIAKKINSSGAGVQASFDNNLGKFFIRTESEGVNSKIEFTTDDTNKVALDDFLETIKIEMTEYNGKVPETILTAGKAFVGTAGEAEYNGVSEVEAKGISGQSVKKIEDKAWNERINKEFSFKINDKVIDVTAEDSLQTIATKINGSASGITAAFDEVTGKFSLSSNKKTGKDVKLTLISNEIPSENVEKNEAGLKEFLNIIDIRMDNYDKNDPDNKSVNGKLGVGDSFKGTDSGNLKIDSNQFSFNGVKFDAKTTGEFTINVATNEEKIVEQVTKFVNDYNKMIEQAGTLLNEKVNKNFRPLTPEQREAMSDKDVEMWEKKAKSGLIKDDMDVKKMLSDLRSDLYKDVEGATGAFKNITQIGVTTQGYKAGGIGGMLQIDEKKLREAIAKDADGVMEILFKEDPLTASANDDDLAKTKITKTNEEGIEFQISGLTDKRNKSGLVTRIFDNLTQGMKGLIAKSGPGTDSELFRKVKSTIMTDFVKKGGKYSGKGSVSDIDDDMMKFTKRIDIMNVSLFRKENSFYAKFTAMEKAMQRASSQSGWLMQQMG